MQDLRFSVENLGLSSPWGLGFSVEDLGFMNGLWGDMPLESARVITAD